MRIKRFEAKNHQSAMALVKQELGDDAIILGTKTIGGKGAGQRVEVVAAMDYDLDTLLDHADLPEEPGPKPAYGYRTIRRPEQPALKAAAQETRGQEGLAAIQSEAHDLRLRFANIFNKPAARFNPPPAVKAPARQGKQPPPTVNEVRQWRDQVIDKINLSSADSDCRQEIIAIVGTTGVGKTTTVAKLAAWHALRRGRSTALISMDCYRIGATDQLRAYARVMRLPCEIALRKNDMGRALARFQDKEVIIIDTAGKSPYDDKHLAELGEWFAQGDDIVPHLVLSATTKKEDLAAVIKAYSGLNIGSLMLTKLDETRAYAVLCQQIASTSLPVSFLSTGQRVPEDFVEATRDSLNMLFKQGQGLEP